MRGLFMCRQVRRPAITQWRNYQVAGCTSRCPNQDAIFYNWNISFFILEPVNWKMNITRPTIYIQEENWPLKKKKKIKATRKKDNTDGIAIANADAISSTPTCHFLLFSPDVCTNTRNLSFRSREIGIHSQLFFTPPPSPNGILHKILRCLSSMAADSKALKINMLSNSERRSGISADYEHDGHSSEDRIVQSVDDERRKTGRQTKDELDVLQLDVLQSLDKSNDRVNLTQPNKWHSIASPIRKEKNTCPITILNAYFKSVFLLPSLHNSGKKRLFESPKILKWKNFFRENLYVILELRNAAGYDYELRWNSIPTVL